MHLAMIPSYLNMTSIPAKPSLNSIHMFWWLIWQLIYSDVVMSSVFNYGMKAELVLLRQKLLKCLLAV